MGKRSRVGLQWSFLLTDVSYRFIQRRNTLLGTSYLNFSAASAMRVSSKLGMRVCICEITSLSLSMETYFAGAVCSATTETTATREIAIAPEMTAPSSESSHLTGLKIINFRTRPAMASTTAFVAKAMATMTDTDKSVRDIDVWANVGRYEMTAGEYLSPR